MPRPDPAVFRSLADEVVEVLEGKHGFRPPSDYARTRAVAEVGALLVRDEMASAAARLDVVAAEAELESTRITEDVLASPDAHDELTRESRLAHAADARNVAAIASKRAHELRWRLATVTGVARPD